MEKFGWQFRVRDKVIQTENDLEFFGRDTALKSKIPVISSTTDYSVSAIPALGLLAT